MMTLCGSTALGDAADRPAYCSSSLGQLGLVEVEELGAIKADAFRAALLHLLHVLRQLDIRGEDDVAAVERASTRFRAAW